MFYPFDYHYYVLKPEKGHAAKNQIADCLNQFYKLVTSDLFSQKIVKINWFFKLSEELHCELIHKMYLASHVAEHVKLSASYIAQAPTDGIDIELVLISLKGIPDSAVSYHTIDEIKFIQIQDETQKWIYVGGSVCQNPDLSIRIKSERSFLQISEALQESGLKFSNIIRQWNYISDIVGEESEEGIVRQNYQEFNEVRGEWYRKNELKSDFPAATGIGTLGDGVRLEIIAGYWDDTMPLSLKNPVQKDAHQYSEDQLIGSIKKSTPLFERGKLVFSQGRGHIWVSGTAAIRGEISVKDDTLGQTKITCENIDQLIQNDNLVAAGLPKENYMTKASYIRAYVKYHSDGLVVQQFLNNHYPGAVVHVLEGDVCRSELLVEIEGEFSITSKSI
jgi:enamine deaminase RidA (YjgF/YER057c/UK114 family)